MTLAAPESAISISARMPSAIIIGTDALLAAAPATPVQLAHACIAAGYQNVVPASWGDELIAAATVGTLDRHGDAPAIQCSCPIVAHRLLAAGNDLRPFLVSLVSPPVAAARYLRAAHAPARIRITYVGRCPGAEDAEIDARLTPDELLADFADRGIVLEEQPRVFDSVIPSDRRRFRSQAGGLPSVEALWSEGGGRSIVEINGGDLAADLAQQLLSGKPVLIDLSCALGCVCSGATPGVEPELARGRVSELEPPRARSAIVDDQLPVELQLTLPAGARNVFGVAAPQRTGTTSGADTPLAASRVPERESRPSSEAPQRQGEGEGEGEREQKMAANAAGSPSQMGNGLPRRHSPARGISRLGTAGMPTARDIGGRQLPRTYVARRRGPIRGARGEATAGATAPESAPEAAAAGPSAASHDPRLAPAASRGASGAPASAATHAEIGGAAAYVPAFDVREHELARTPREVPDAASSGVRERAVELPVTPLSDTRSGEQFDAKLAAGGEYSLRQLFTFGLLIGAIVLVSAVLGIVVGRWLAAH